MFLGQVPQANGRKRRERGALSDGLGQVLTSTRSIASLEEDLAHVEARLAAFEAAGSLATTAPYGHAALTADAAGFVSIRTGWVW